MDFSEKKFCVRTFRAEQAYSADAGKWCYDFEVTTPGYMKVGWTQVSSETGKELGPDGFSYAFDGFWVGNGTRDLRHMVKCGKKGDIIGCMLDVTYKAISVSLNGELLMDRMGQEIAFKGIDLSEPYVPAISLGPGHHDRVNFGQDVHTLKFLTCCGLQEGYEPFCVNMTRPMPLWYVKEQATFEPLAKDHSRIEIVRVPGGSTWHSKTFGTLKSVSRVLATDSTSLVPRSVCGNQG